MSPEDAIATLMRAGALIPVQVFGASMDDEEQWSYGLSDRFSTHAVAGSDCNRADAFLLRPADAMMDAPVVRAALRDVLWDPDERIKP